MNMVTSECRTLRGMPDGGAMSDFVFYASQISDIM